MVTRNTTTPAVVTVPMFFAQIAKCSPGCTKISGVKIWPHWLVGMKPIAEPVGIACKDKGFLRGAFVLALSAVAKEVAVCPQAAE